MLVHAIMAGSVGLILIEPKSIYFMSEIIFFSLLINLLILFKEIVFHHDTPDTKRTIELITKGYFSKIFLGWYCDREYNSNIFTRFSK